MKTIVILLVLACSQLGYAKEVVLNPLNQLMNSHFDTKNASQNPKPVTKNASQSQHVLVFFFSNKCPHCVQFSPVVQDFVDANHWNIEAISLNGETIPEFPNASFATQEMIDLAYQGKPVVYPALFIANPNTKALYPVAFGELGKQELLERMKLIMTKVGEYEGSHS